MPDRPTGDAMLFPGQGSQHDDMRAAVASAAPDLLRAATELIGADPFDHLGEGTLFTQPAIFCASMASWYGIAAMVRPVAFAGHSFGEFAALAAAGAVDVLDALRLVVLRGRLTSDVASGLDGGMLALLGVAPDIASALAERHGVVVANDNCPGQLVLSGDNSMLSKVEIDVEEMGAQSRRLAVAGPFHSPLMSAAVKPFALALSTVRFRAPVVPVYSGVTAAPFEDVQAQLSASLVSPVRWRTVVERLGAAGTGRFVEVAPGDVLSKMVRRTVRGVPRVVAEHEAVSVGHA